MGVPKEDVEISLDGGEQSVDEISEGVVPQLPSVRAVAPSPDRHMQIIQRSPSPYIRPCASVNIITRQRSREGN